jgi:hypothetical protein
LQSGVDEKKSDELIPDEMQPIYLFITQIQLL